MKQVTYNGLTFEPYIEREKIQKRIEELAKEITAEFKGRRPLLVCVLNGAFPFASELFLNIDTDAEIAFIRLKSYEGTSSTGTVKEVMGLTAEIAGRPVILVEDIVDTGRTLKEVKKLLLHKGAADVKIVSLLDKPSRRVIEIQADYVGFEIPNEFVVGYGLDYDQKYRNLPYIGVLRPQVYENR